MGETPQVAPIDLVEYRGTLSLSLGFPWKKRLFGSGVCETVQKIWQRPESKRKEVVYYTERNKKRPFDPDLPKPFLLCALIWSAKQCKTQKIRRYKCVIWRWLGRMVENRREKCCKTMRYALKTIQVIQYCRENVHRKIKSSGDE